MTAKKIDEKHHIIYDDFAGIQIIKTGNGVAIPSDEPTILFRGRDNLAVAMLQFYQQLCKNAGATEYQLATLTIMIKKFEDFALANPATMKQPGITKGL